jgi:Peptidase family M28
MNTRSTAFAFLFLLMALGAGAACAPVSAAAPSTGPSTQIAAAYDSPSTAGVQARSADPLVTSPALQEQVGPPLAPLGDRAMEVVRTLADGIGSRPAGSAAERTAASFLADQFEGIGYGVDVVPFSVSTRSGPGQSRNVIAYDQNEDPNVPLVIIGGHYDTVPAGPGANDNGSGTATTLEVARQLAAAPVPGVAVRYVAFGAEEVGLLGSKEYVSRMTRADRARTRVMMSIDMMAVGAQPAFGGSDPWLSEALARAASQGWQPEELSTYLRRMSDHASFLDAGIPAIMFHWVDDPYYHTALDVSSNVQPYSMELMGAIAIELIRVAAR